MKKTLKKSKVLQGIFRVLCSGLVKLLSYSVRYTVEGMDNVVDAASRKGCVIFACWHNQLLVMPYVYRSLLQRRSLAAVVSGSRDGGFVSSMLQSYQVKPIRGSSSRGGIAAFREIASWVKAGKDAAITPDGPRGPVYKVQQGVMRLARMSGVPIVPVSCVFSRYWELPTWDRFVIPWPFTKALVRFAAPMEVSGHRSGSGDMESQAGKLEHILLSMMQETQMGKEKIRRNT